VVAYIQGRRTHYYDSPLAESSDRGLKHGEATKKYLADVALKCALAISSETLDIASWEIVLRNAADVPEQEINSDCGVLTPLFSQVDVPVFRRRITLDLLRKEITLNNSN
jgi:hypothetical protein